MLVLSDLIQFYLPILKPTRLNIFNGKLFDTSVFDDIRSKFFSTFECLKIFEGKLFRLKIVFNLIRTRVIE